MIESELDKKELDEEHLSSEIKKMEKQQHQQRIDLLENADKIKKYIVDKSQAEKLIGGVSNEKSGETLKKLNNNNETDFKSSLPRESDKSKLNIDVDSAIFTKI